MDAYTARCLQVSTNVSDTLPLQRRYRPDVMKRQNSAREGRIMPMRPVHSRSKTSIGGLWPAPTAMDSLHRYPVANNPMSMQSYRFESPQSNVTPVGTPFPMQYMATATPYTPNEWGMPMQYESKQLQGLGMEFSEDFIMNKMESPDDIIHLNDNDMWAISDPASPEHCSSTTGSETTDLTESTLAGQAAVYDNMRSRDERRSRSIHRHSRSLSRTPASRAASKRAHRRQLSCQPVPHDRTMSHGGYMPTLPQTPALLQDQATQEALALELSNIDFMDSDFTKSHLSMDNGFQNNFDALMDIQVSMSPAVSPRHLTPPSNAIFWDDTTFDHNDIFNTSSDQACKHEHSPQAGCRASPTSDDVEKPDLFESLREEPCNPPEGDMHPADADMVPQEQEPRFEGDLYTPRWVRGQGNKREGWCGLCKPGRWLVLKNSAYWYDKSFTHGVSAATGQSFESPRETRRMVGNPDVWEGLCGGCNEWIALISSKKKGTTWFRHAYKCHGKSKDPKKARQSSPTRQTKAFASMKPVPIVQQQQRQQQQQQQQQQPRQDMFPMSHISGFDILNSEDVFSDMTFL